MDVQTCIDYYKVLAHDVFQERKGTKIGGAFIAIGAAMSALGTAKFSSTNLREAIMDVLSKARPPLNDMTALIEDEEVRTCRVFVCTTMKNTRALRLRNYSIPSEDIVRCTILEAAMATSAAPTFFNPVKIRSVGVTLYDGALKRNNPVEEAVLEIDAEFRNKPIGCIVSVGTGVSKDENLGKSLVSIAKACAKIAVDTEDTHYRFKERECSDGGRLRGKYSRFNVDQGLQSVGLAEWKAIDDMWGVTRTYMDRQKETALQCTRCLTDLDKASLSTTAITPFLKNQSIGTSDPPYSNLDNYGLSPVNFFCQREEQIQNINRIYDKAMVPNRAACCLRGIGGSGKTQLALWYAKMHYCRIYNTVLWFDANSPQRLAECFLSTAKILGIMPATSAQSRAVSKRWEADYVIALKEWLSRRKGQYLLIFDNSDTVEMVDLLCRFFPDTNKGHILVTSRRERVYLLGQTVLVEGLPPQSALDLLLYHAGIKDPSVRDRALGYKVVSELGYLALAVDLAGVFIRTLRGDIRRYSRMYAESKDKVNKMALNENHNAAASSYPYSLFAAWAVSRNSLSEPAQRFLHLLSFFNRENINLDIFRRCCETRVRWNVDGELAFIPPAESGVPDWLLAATTSDNGAYDQYKLTKIVSEICSVSFASTENITGPRLYQYDQTQLLELDMESETTVINIHPLLHEIGCLYLDAEQQLNFAEQAECILWHSIDDDADRTLREPNQKYFPVLHSGGGATTRIPLFISRLDEAFRHLQSVMLLAFEESFRDDIGLVSDTGNLRSYYFCLLLLIPMRVLGARTLTQLKNMAWQGRGVDGYVQIELKRSELLRREDLTTQWLRLASRQCEVMLRSRYINGLVKSECSPVWKGTVDCELETYNKYLTIKRAANSVALEHAEIEQVLTFQGDVGIIQGSQLHRQVMLGRQNSEYTIMVKAS